MSDLTSGVRGAMLLGQALPGLVGHPQFRRVAWDAKRARRLALGLAGIIALILLASLPLYLLTRIVATFFPLPPFKAAAAALHPFALTQPILFAAPQVLVMMYEAFDKRSDAPLWVALSHSNDALCTSLKNTPRAYAPPPGSPYKRVIKMGAKVAAALALQLIWAVPSLAAVACVSLPLLWAQSVAEKAKGGGLGSSSFSDLFMSSVVLSATRYLSSSSSSLTSTIGRCLIVGALAYRLTDRKELAGVGAAVALLPHVQRPLAIGVRALSSASVLVPELTRPLRDRLSPAVRRRLKDETHAKVLGFATAAHALLSIPIVGATLLYPLIQGASAALIADITAREPAVATALNPSAANKPAWK